MAGGAADEAQAAITAATGGKPAVSTAVESKARHSQSVASGYLKLIQNRRLLIWLGMLLTIATLPEPKGKTLEEMEEFAYEPMTAKVKAQPGLAG